MVSTGSLNLFLCGSLIEGAPSTVSVKARYVFIARHGERMDMVDTEESRNWLDATLDSMDPGRCHDPPLTHVGFQQVCPR